VLASRSPSEVVTRLLPRGLVLAVVGWVLSLWMPLNKNLFTLSYAALTAGMAAVLLAACIAAIDTDSPPRAKAPPVARPFIHLGCNCLFAFVVACVMADVFFEIDTGAVPHDGSGDSSLYHWMYLNVFRSWIADDRWASCVSAVALTVVYMVLTSVLYWRRIFIKV
jgi:predicted acyltransferase